MLDSITIKNFKAIKSENDLTLSNLAPVNYLVGKNGSGKSSVLERIWLEYNNPSEEGKFYEVNVRDKYWRGKIIEYTQNYGNLFSIDLENTKKWQEYFRNLTQYSRIEITYKTEFSYLKYTKDLNTCIFLTKNERKFSSLNKTMDSYLKEDLDKIEYLPSEIKDILSKEIRNIYTKVKIEKVKIFKKNNFELPSTFLPKTTGGVDLSKISSGFRQLLILITNLNIYTKYVNYIIIIEEPETHLHPKFQKFIPKILHEFTKNHPNIQFLISTHSPFIISAASKFDDQKVYLIEGGQTVDLFGTKGEGQKGFSGGEVLNVVNDMLGANLSDYFGDLCFLAENSVCRFLQGLKDNVNLNLRQFSYILGNGEDEKRSKQDEELRNKAYIYSGTTDNLRVIIDGEKRDVFKTYKESYGKRLICLNKDEIETIYPINLVNQFLEKRTYPNLKSKK